MDWPVLGDILVEGSIRHQDEGAGLGLINQKETIRVIMGNIFPCDV